MIKPLLNEYERFIIISYPNTRGASLLKLKLAVASFRREIERYILKITL